MKTAATFTVPCIDGETWAPVPGFEPYCVSRTGEVLSFWHARPRMLAAAPCSSGYLTVRLVAAAGSKPVTRTVHSLVAEAFIGPRPSDDHEVRHLDGNRHNNTADNLAYGSRSENRWDSVRHGTHAQISKTHCPQGHPYDEQNTMRTAAGHRRCRACRSAGQAQAAYRMRRNERRRVAYANRGAA